MKLFCWHRFIVFSPVRTLLLSAVAVLCVFALSILIGCSKADRHKVLTFFFDGVPPLALEYLDPNSPEYADQIKALEKVSKASTHETGENCKHCHTGGLLKKPVPELCYTCHDDYTQQGIYVHAPVLVGDCLFCHRSHSAPNPSLLRKSIPALCFKCHDRQAVILIENHDKEEYNLCAGCHSAHVTSSRYLLRGGAKPPKVSAEITVDTPEISDPNAIQENKNETADDDQQR